jgi:hypothetical protein
MNITEKEILKLIKEKITLRFNWKNDLSQEIKNLTGFEDCLNVIGTKNLLEYLDDWIEELLDLFKPNDSEIVRRMLCKSDNCKTIEQIEKLWGNPEILFKKCQFEAKKEEKFFKNISKNLSK